MLGVFSAEAASAKVLTVTKSGSGTVISVPSGINCGATCSANFATGQVVTLTATPSTGYIFLNWTGACTGAKNCAVTMATNQSVRAVFGAIINGTCGSSKGKSFSTTPATNLCSTGTATSVTTNAATYTWNCTGSNGGTTASCSANRLIPPTATLSATPTTLTTGQSTTLTWSSTNATSCAASNGWSGTKALSGSETLSPSATTTYALTCTGTGGTTSLQSVTVTVSGSTGGTGSTTASGPIYSTNFDLTESPISEGGRWQHTSNGWKNVTTATGLAYGNGPTDGYDDSYALLSGFGPDQTAQATVTRSPNLNVNANHEVELLLRFTDSATTARGYECLFSAQGSYMVVRWNGNMGDWTMLSPSYTDSNWRQMQTGDVVKCSIQGSTIRQYVNDLLVGVYADSSIPTGQPGISFFTRPGGTAAHFGFTSYSVTDGTKP